MSACRAWEGPPHPDFALFWYRMLDECGLLGSGVVPDWRDRLNRHFAEAAAAGLLQLFVAEDGGRIVGTCGAFLSGGRSHILLDVTATLAGVYVEPSHRGRGFARTMTELAIAWCRSRNCVQIRLHASETGRALYESLGFVTAGEMMRLDLS